VRRLAWVAIGLAVVGVVAVVVIALSLNSLIEKNRDRILDQARSALGRRVAADRVVVNLWGGLGARIDNLRIGDDPQFGEGDFLRATAAVAVVDLWPLLHRNLHIRSVELREPRIQLIRSSSGSWNYESLGHPQAPVAAERPAPAPSDSGAPKLLPFALAAANIDNGTVAVIDHTQQPSLNTTVAQIKLKVSDLSETTPMNFDFQAAVSEDSPNVKLHGAIGPMTDPSAIALMVDGSLGPLGARKLRIDTVHLEATITPAALQIVHLDGGAFDGAFQLNGQVPLRREAEMRARGELANMSIPQVLALFSDDASKRVAGHGLVRLDLRATGASTAAMRATLAGQVATDLHDATLKDFNIVREVLGRGSRLPLLGDLISGGVKPQYEQMAATPDTRFQTLRATFNIAAQTLHTKDLLIEATDFAVRAAGSINFDQEADLTGTLAMSPAFSRQVANDVKEAKYLLGEDQRLEMPFRLRGRLGVAKPQPDTNALVASLGQKMTSGGAKNLLMELLGGSSQARPTPRPGEAAGGGVEQGLRRLFGR